MNTNTATETSYDELLDRNAVLSTEVLDLKRTVILLSQQLVTLRRGMFGRSYAAPLSIYIPPAAAGRKSSLPINLYTGWK